MRLCFNPSLQNILCKHIEITLHIRIEIITSRVVYSLPLVEWEKPTLWFVCWLITSQVVYSRSLEKAYTLVCVWLVSSGVQPPWLKMSSKVCFVPFESKTMRKNVLHQVSENNRMCSSVLLSTPPRDALDSTKIGIVKLSEVFMSQC